MANPRGMTNIAGPGNTIMATPINSTVNPITAMMTLLICRMVFSVEDLQFFGCRSYFPRWFHFSSAPLCQETVSQMREKGRPSRQSGNPGNSKKNKLLEITRYLSMTGPAWMPASAGMTNYETLSKEGGFPTSSRNKIPQPAFCRRP